MPSGSRCHILDRRGVGPDFLIEQVLTTDDQVPIASSNRQIQKQRGGPIRVGVECLIEGGGVVLLKAVPQ